MQKPKTHNEGAHNGQQVDRQRLNLKYAGKLTRDREAGWRDETIERLEREK